MIEKWATDFNVNWLDVGLQIQHNPTELERFIQYCVNRNPGVIALALCIAGANRFEVMKAFCGIHDRKHYAKKRDTSCTGAKMGKVIQLYKRHKGKLSNVEIAKRVGCTKEYVCIVLKRKLGIGKRNRWEGYISKDPRYSKEKRKRLEEQRHG